MLRTTRVTSDARSPSSKPTSQERLVEDSLPRGSTFVGRLAELSQLRSAFEAAAAGHGAVVMVVGEPGIGKTALCDQFCRFVSDVGGKFLVGHCYEEGSFRLPYQPFVEMFGTYLEDNDSDPLLSEVGSSAADLIRLVGS